LATESLQSATSGTRGKGSGADTESPFGTVVDILNGKAIRVRSYLDCDEALAAADLRE
jgi:hypothetical protein